MSGCPVDRSDIMIRLNNGPVGTCILLFVLSVVINLDYIGSCVVDKRNMKPFIFWKTLREGSVEIVVQHPKLICSTVVQTNPSKICILSIFKYMLLGASAKIEPHSKRPRVISGDAYKRTGKVIAVARFRTLTSASGKITISR